MQFVLSRVEPGQGEQVLHDMGHAVALVENDPQKLFFCGGRQLSGAVREGLGVAADVGKGGAQLVGDIGHKFPLHILGFPLLGHIVEHHQHAALAVPVKGSQQQLQEAFSLPALLLQIVRSLEHLFQRKQITEEFLIGSLGSNGTAQHLLGGRIGVDDLSVAGKGHHAVGHVQKQGIQLVALIFHLAQGVLKLSGHVVKGVGEYADLIPGGHLDLSGEVSVGHTHGALGEALDGDDHGLGQQEGQQDGDDQTKDQGLQNQHKHLADEAVHRGLVVQNIDHIGGAAPVQGDGHVHIVGGHIGTAGVLPSGQCVGEIGRIIGQVLTRIVVVAGQVLPGLPVQDKQGAAVTVQAQLAGVGLQDVKDGLGSVFLPLGGRGQIPGQGLPGEHIGHLGIEVLRVVIGNRIDQKCTYHRHQGDNQQRHDEHELHVQASKHGDTPSQFFQEMQRRPEPRR